MTTGSWYAVWLPAKTPDAIISRLHGEIVKIVADHELRERLMPLGLDTVCMTPLELKRYIEQDLNRWARVIKTAGIKVD